MKSPFYRKTSDKITKIEIVVSRDNGVDSHIAFIKEDKIKDLITNEPFFKELIDNL